MILRTLHAQGLIHPPRWLADNTQYLTMMGSQAYGVAGEASDVDTYGFTIPPKDLVFPHLAGHVEGFGRQVPRFEVWQQHHVRTLDGAKEYDFAVYSIVRFFHLAMENNPNMVDALFTPRRCVLHATGVAEHVRENRRLFLHKGAFHKFRGYAYAQLAKIKGRVNSSNPKRAALIAAHGFDTKFAYHIVRLALEVEQILETGDLDLERDREIMKSIRRGEWPLERIEAWFTEKERALQDLYTTSKLPHAPDEDRLKALLVECLEMHYGSLASAVSRDPSASRLIEDLKDVIGRYEAQARLAGRDIPAGAA